MSSDDEEYLDRWPALKDFLQHLIDLDIPNKYDVQTIPASRDPEFNKKAKHNKAKHQYVLNIPDRFNNDILFP